jgi:hypothetical protein
LLFIIYTINLPVVWPRSGRVIYYFDTPTLGKRHQSFGHVIDPLNVRENWVTVDLEIITENWVPSDVWNW